jgi:hypothetical protein
MDVTDGIGYKSNLQEFFSVCVSNYKGAIIRLRNVPWA